MHGIKVLMAKNYIDNLSEETRKGMTEKAEQGIWPSYAPFGYCNVVGENSKKTIEPDLDVAPVVCQMFEWYATGQYSVREVTRMARREGLSFRKTGKSVPQSSVQKMLRNRIYMGEFCWDGKIYQGSHEPIVSGDLWEKVQDVLDGRKANPSRKPKRDFAFTGLIRCGTAVVRWSPRSKRVATSITTAAAPRGNAQALYSRGGAGGAVRRVA